MYAGVMERGNEQTYDYLESSTRIPGLDEE
jgi:hypothetical protein